MAVSPKDLMREDGVQESTLAALEKFVDDQLKHYTPVPGQAISVCYDKENVSCPNAATVKALKRLYTKAGWQNVGVNTTHSIITVTCPVYRTR